MGYVTVSFREGATQNNPWSWSFLGDMVTWSFFFKSMFLVRPCSKSWIKAHVCDGVRSCLLAMGNLRHWRSCCASCGGAGCFFFSLSFGKKTDRHINCIYTLPGTCLSSILGLQPSKTRSFPIKTRVIWVPGIQCVHLSFPFGSSQGDLDCWRLVISSHPSLGT